jgi:glutathione S-transferase
MDAQSKTTRRRTDRETRAFRANARTKPFLLDGQPRFVDFDLWGMLANFLYSGHYKLPAILPKLKQWYGRMSRSRFERPAQT